MLYGFMIPALDLPHNLDKKERRNDEK